MGVRNSMAAAVGMGKLDTDAMGGGSYSRYRDASLCCSGPKVKSVTKKVASNLSRGRADFPDPAPAEVGESFPDSAPASD